MKEEISVFSQKKFYIYLTLTVVGGLLLVQGIFFILMRSNSITITKTLTESFDIGLYEADFDNAAILMRNLEKANVLNCVSLKIQALDRLFSVYTSAFQENCSPVEWLLQGVHVQGSLVGNTGNSWLYSFVIRMGPSHLLLLWFSRLLAIFFSSVLVFFVFQNSLNIKIKRNEIALNMRAVAHDLTSPIGLLRMLYNSRANIDQNKTMEYIKRATERLADISQTILDGTIDVDSDSSKSFNVQKVIDKIVKEKRDFFGNSARFEVSIGELKKVNVMGASHRFERILSNMINNAFEALASETGTLLMKFKVESRHPYMHVLLSDNGRGISENLVNSLGDKVVVSSKVGGNGLGLYLAKKDLKEWGGDLEVLETGPEGTTFRISLLTKV